MASYIDKEWQEKLKQYCLNNDHRHLEENLFERGWGKGKLRPGLSTLKCFDDHGELFLGRLMVLACSNDHLESGQVLVGALSTEQLNGMYKWGEPSWEGSASTPLHNASWNGHEKVVSLLLQHGADVNAVDKSASTPLHNASWNGHEKVVSLLLQHGADVNAINKDGDSALDTASTKGYLESVSALLEHMAKTYSYDKMMEIVESGSVARKNYNPQCIHLIKKFLYQRLGSGSEPATDISWDVVGLPGSGKTTFLDSTMENTYFRIEKRPDLDDQDLKRRTCGMELTVFIVAKGIVVHVKDQGGQEEFASCHSAFDQSSYGPCIAIIVVNGFLPIDVVEKHAFHAAGQVLCRRRCYNVDADKSQLLPAVVVFTRFDRINKELSAGEKDAKVKALLSLYDKLKTTMDGYLDLQDCWIRNAQSAKSSEMNSCRTQLSQLCLNVLKGAQQPVLLGRLRQTLRKIQKQLTVPFCTREEFRRELAKHLHIGVAGEPDDATFRAVDLTIDKLASFALVIKFSQDSPVGDLIVHQPNWLTSGITGVVFKPPHFPPPHISFVNGFISRDAFENQISDAFENQISDMTTPGCGHQVAEMLIDAGLVIEDDKQIVVPGRLQRVREILGTWERKETPGVVCGRSFQCKKPTVIGAGVPIRMQTRLHRYFQEVHQKSVKLSSNLINVTLTNPPVEAVVSFNALQVFIICRATEDGEHEAVCMLHFLRHQLYQELWRTSPGTVVEEGVVSIKSVANQLTQPTINCLDTHSPLEQVADMDGAEVRYSDDKHHVEQVKDLLLCQPGDVRVMSRRGRLAVQAALKSIRVSQLAETLHMPSPSHGMSCNDVITRWGEEKNGRNTRALHRILMTSQAGRAGVYTRLLASLGEEEKMIDRALSGPLPDVLAWERSQDDWTQAETLSVARVRRVRGFVCGEYRTGKSSFIRATLEDVFVEGADSTPGVHVERTMVHFDSGSGCVARFQRFPGVGRLFVEMMAERLHLKSQPDYEATPTVAGSVRDEMATGHFPQMSSKPINVTGHETFAELQRMGSAVSLEDVEEPNATSDQSSLSTCADDSLLREFLPTESSEFKALESDQKEKMKAEVRAQLKKIQDLPQDKPVSRTYFEFWDCAGQMTMTTQQSICLDTTRSFFVLVFNASKDLDEEVTVEIYRQGGENIAVPALFKGMTHRDFILMWLAVIAFRQQRDSSSSKLGQDSKIRKTNVFLVGTHIDDVQDKESVTNEIRKELGKIASQAGSDSLELKGPYFVDNRRIQDAVVKDPRYNQMVELQQDLAKTIGSVEEEEMPLSWMKLEDTLHLWQECKQSSEELAVSERATSSISRHHMTFSFFSKLAQYISNGRIVSSDVEKVVTLFHQLGSVICHDCDHLQDDSLIFLNAEWMLKEFVRLLIYPLQEFRSPDQLILAADLKSLREKGIVSAPLLKAVWCDLDESVWKSIMATMCHFHLARPLEQATKPGGGAEEACEGQRYFVQFCLTRDVSRASLPSPDAEDDDWMRLPPLLLKFKTGFFPPPIYNLVALHCSKHFSAEDVSMEHSAMIISVENVHDVRISWSPYGLKLEVCSSGEEMEVPEACAELLGAVDHCLEELRNEHGWAGLSWHLAFRCACCPDSWIELPAKWDKKGAKRRCDSCQHHSIVPDEVKSHWLRNDCDARICSRNGSAPSAVSEDRRQVIHAQAPVVGRHDTAADLTSIALNPKASDALSHMTSVADQVPPKQVMVATSPESQAVLSGDVAAAGPVNMTITNIRDSHVNLGGPVGNSVADTSASAASVCDNGDVTLSDSLSLPLASVPDLQVLGNRVAKHLTRLQSDTIARLMVEKNGDSVSNYDNVVIDFILSHGCGHPEVWNFPGVLAYFASNRDNTLKDALEIIVLNCSPRERCSIAGLFRDPYFSEAGPWKRSEYKEAYHVLIKAMHPSTVKRACFSLQLIDDHHMEDIQALTKCSDQNAEILKIVSSQEAFFGPFREILHCDKQLRSIARELDTIGPDREDDEACLEAKRILNKQPET